MRVNLMQIWRQVQRWARPRPARSTKEVGQRAEKAAGRYLRRQGYQILECNVQMRFGEIDILAVHEGWLVIAEVRSHKQGSVVRPREALSREKQRRLRALAEQVRKRPGLRELPVRIDLVEVATDEYDRPITVEILRGAC